MAENPRYPEPNRDIFKHPVNNEQAKYEAFVRQVLPQLESPQLQELIDQGYATVGIIRPELSSEKVEEIIRDIKPPLRVALRVPMKISKEAVNEMWEGHSKQNQQEKSAHNPYRYMEEAGELMTRWEENVVFMMKPLDFLVIISDEPNAVAQWRQQMGSSWNADKIRDETEAIRVKHALPAPEHLHNTIVHGSATTQEAKKELAVIVGELRKALEARVG